MFKFPVIELVDKFCISKLKISKGVNCTPEYEFYADQLKNINVDLIKDELEELYQCHSRIWEYEDDFKKFRIELKYNIEQIAFRAMLVRDLNAMRYEIKNRIADKLNDTVREMKRYG